jgi:nicotinate dehydrogenase subunit A
MEPVPLSVNGNSVKVAADPDTPLLDVLRNHLGLMGTKFGCGLEQCGCCMVLVDGKPEKSCGRSLSAVAGKEIVTIEGLGTRDRPHPLQHPDLGQGIARPQRIAVAETDRRGIGRQYLPLRQPHPHLASS